MKVVSWDVETFKIMLGCITPQLVCVTTYDGKEEKIYLSDVGLEVMRGYLEDESVHLVAYNTVFDLAILCAEDSSFIPLVFKAIEQGRIHCAMLREQVIDNYHGRLKF